MKRLIFLAFGLIVVIVHLSIAQAQLTFNKMSGEQAAISTLSSRPLCFTENRGQWDSKALYKEEAGGATFWFCKDQVVFQFIRDTKEPLDDGMPEMPGGMPNKFNHPRFKKESIVLQAEFVGANPEAQIETADRLSHNNNYFIGNDPAKWATDVPNWSSITYKDIYPGIDLTYHGDGKGMKYDFIIQPGADIAQIKIKYEGAEKVAISNNGDLEATTSFGPAYERIPSIYQEIDGAKKEIAGEYALREDGSFGFNLTEEYNPNYAVVIDPELVYSTYLGGSEFDEGRQVAIGPGSIKYITGSTNSINFPVMNPYQPFQDSTSLDVFITAFSPNGNSIIFSTYLGGNRNDFGIDIAVDTYSNIYIVGGTFSPNFPMQNPYQTYQSSMDIFITKIAPTGNSFIYSTNLGGNGIEEALAICVDLSGNAIITGGTNSANYPLQNPYQVSYGGNPWDAFVTKISSNGQYLFYSTYLGGDYEDVGDDIKLSVDNTVYVTGRTSSSNFPTQNPIQPTSQGDEAFVTKFSESGNSVIYSTYLGTTGNYGGTWGIAAAVDYYGCAYITGITAAEDYPLKNPYQGILNGQEDAFISKISPSGESLLYSTYLGGSNEECGFDIVLDQNCNAYITGRSNSLDFPIIDAYQDSCRGSDDCFMTCVSSSGNSLIYSTYLGGNDGDYGSGITIDKNGNIYITGGTLSLNFPLQNPFQNTFGGGVGDAFLTIFSPQTSVNNYQNPIPFKCSLSQNYPNPFNAQTTISYSLPKASLVTIDIYDLLGRKLETLVNLNQNAGSYSIIWDAAERSSGIYFCRIKAAEISINRKMVLVK